jgi:hypothetical protein
MIKRSGKVSRYMAAVVLFLLAGCGGSDSDDIGNLISGRPQGPYELSLSVTPHHPQPNELVMMEFQLTFRQSGKPVIDLQTAHERLIHNFITDLEFSTFAHIHHEDYYPVTAADRAQGRLRFPFRFPHAGQYRVVSEFAHRNRSWTKHFDVKVGDSGKPGEASPQLKPALEDTVGEFSALLEIPHAGLNAGFETPLVFSVTRNGIPVTDLALYLGTEMHGAIWRADGKHFGHLHSYTKKVAALLELAHQRDSDASKHGALLQEMMVQLMCLQAELEFPGPSIPMRYVFSESGRYVIFVQVAPRGTPVEFKFVVDVGAAIANSQTMLPPK